MKDWMAQDIQLDPVPENLQVMAVENVKAWCPDDYEDILAALGLEDVE